MSIACDIIIKWKATPVQLAELGNALWRWCSSTRGQVALYQLLDNQALADLMAGKLPIVDERTRGIHFRVRDRFAHNSQSAVGALRHELPGEAIADVLIDGISWNTIDARDSAAPVLRPLVTVKPRTGFAGTVSDLPTLGIPTGEELPSPFG
jgi:hypothetical protein